MDDRGFGRALDEDRWWGASRLDGDVWRLALWAPGAAAAEVDVAGRRSAMERLPDGRLAAHVRASAGERYRFVMDGAAFPDPAARAQSGGVHGWSVLVDHDAFAWATPWAGRPWEEAVVYEMHVGAFTPEGTFAAAARKLPELADLGITAVELMPVGQFPGRRGWGYDGVLPFAPHEAYGAPDDLKAFVDAAHACGLMALLDVVYNHFGPDGACLHEIAPAFFDAARTTPWGPGIDYAQPAVRAFFVENALMWLRDYRFDGLRLDAVHQIADPSDPDLVERIAACARAEIADRPIHLIAEDERNVLRHRERGAVRAVWNDDWHHAVHCALTGEREGYYASFAVDPVGDLLAACRQGHVEQGQPRPGRDGPRGEPAGHLPTTAFVNANQTHDQIGNRAHGERLLALADPRGAAAAHALLLSAPFVPMLFMGEEAGETAPFLFFTDHADALAEAVRDGRRAEFARFAGFYGDAVPDPNAVETFERSRPFRRQTEGGGDWRALTRAILAFRRARVVPLLRSGRDGPALARRTGEFSFTCEWRFRAGVLSAHVNLGAPPRRPPRAAAHDVAVGDLAADPFAFAASVTET